MNEMWCRYCNRNVRVCVTSAATNQQVIRCSRCGERVSVALSTAAPKKE